MTEATTCEKTGGKKKKVTFLVKEAEKLRKKKSKRDTEGDGPKEHWKRCLKEALLWIRP